MKQDKTTIFLVIVNKSYVRDGIVLTDVKESILFARVKIL